MSDVEDPQTRKNDRVSSAMDYLEAEVTKSWTDLILILNCFVTGLLDSAVFNVWSCFVSMQTGNTLYAGLGVSGQPKDQPWRWAKSAVSIISFVLGCFLFSRLMRWLGPLKRSTIMLSSVLQSLLCFISAALITSRIVPGDAGQLLPENFIVLLPLSLLSLSAAGQIVVSRLLGFSEITTVVLTSAYCDLVFDQKLTANPTENSKRNRRLASILFTVAGAIAGGFLTVDDDISQAIWVTGGLKLFIAVLWTFWKSESSIRLED